MGEAGGGIATALGIRGRGVLSEGPALVGVGSPILVRLDPGFGVPNGDWWRVGEDVCLGLSWYKACGRPGLSES